MAWHGDSRQSSAHIIAGCAPTWSRGKGQQATAHTTRHTGAHTHTHTPTHHTLLPLATRCTGTQTHQPLRDPSSMLPEGHTQPSQTCSVQRRAQRMSCYTSMHAYAQGAARGSTPGAVGGGARARGNHTSMTPVSARRSTSSRVDVKISTYRLLFGITCHKGCRGDPSRAQVQV